MTLFRTAILMLSVAACGAQSVEPSNSGARDRWESSGITSYQFHYKLNCFCIGPAARGVTIVVADGQVKEVIDNESDARVEDIQDFDTIETLFEKIDKYDRDQVHSYSASYHPDLGYPTDFFVDVDALMADEEWGFTVSNLEIVNP